MTTSPPSDSISPYLPVVIRYQVFAEGYGLKHQHQEGEEQLLKRRDQQGDLRDRISRCVSS